MRLSGIEQPLEACGQVRVFQPPVFTLRPQQEQVAPGESVSWQITLSNDCSTLLRQLRLRLGNQLLANDVFDL